MTKKIWVITLNVQTLCPQNYNIMKKLFFLYFLFCFSCSMALAQNNNNWLAYSESESVHILPDRPIRVQVANYVFRKFDAKRRILAFTQTDADLLREFFLAKQGVLACETHTLDKSIKVLTRADGNGYWGLDHQQLIDELATLGLCTCQLQIGFPRAFPRSTPQPSTSKRRLYRLWRCKGERRVAQKIRGYGLW